jgi:hypothetical protein
LTLFLVTHRTFFYYFCCIQYQFTTHGKSEAKKSLPPVNTLTAPLTQSFRCENQHASGPSWGLIILLNKTREKLKQDVGCGSWFVLPEMLVTPNVVSRFESRDNGYGCCTSLGSGDSSFKFEVFSNRSRMTGQRKKDVPLPQQYI